MVVLVNCKNEEDPIKNEGARVVTTLFINYLRYSRGANIKIKICDGILTKFKLIQALIAVIIVCKNEEDPFKFESTRVVAIFLPL